MSEVNEYEGEDLSSITEFRENSIKGPQRIEIENYRLGITGLVEHPVEYTYDQVISENINYKKVVRLNCVEGWGVTILWEGVLVADILKKAKPLPGASVVIFHAYDGYITSLPVDYVVDNNILLAYKINGAMLPPVRGFPFQLVAEDKWGYKWIKWVVAIELSDDVNYEGYWESRGYSNTGNLDDGYFKR